MKNVYIYCEGQTEESFVNTVLNPYFANMSIYVTPIIHKTKRTPSGSYKGGVSNYTSIKKELIKLCNYRDAFVTTMFDYYGMPEDTPAIDHNDPDIYARIEYIEKKIADDIGCRNLEFNLMLHEFEGLLFSDPQAFEDISDKEVVEKLQVMRNEAITPEHINNSPTTAPSKRIGSVINSYTKVRQGIIVAKKIGIDKMMSECKHFETWIKKIIDAAKE